MPIKEIRADQGQTHMDMRSNRVRLPLIDEKRGSQSRRRSMWRILFIASRAATL